MIRKWYLILINLLFFVFYFPSTPAVTPQRSAAPRATPRAAPRGKRRRTEDPTELEDTLTTMIRNSHQSKNDLQAYMRHTTIEDLMANAIARRLKAIDRRLVRQVEIQLMLVLSNAETPLAPPTPIPALNTEPLVREARAAAQAAHAAQAAALPVPEQETSFLNLLQF